MSNFKLSKTILDNVIPSIAERQEKKQTSHKKDSPKVGHSAENIANKSIERAKSDQYVFKNPRLAKAMLIPGLFKRFEYVLSILRRDSGLTLREVFRTLVMQSSKYKEVHTAQSTLGRRAKITREHANGILQDLQALGFVRIQNRGVYNTCIYFVNESIFAEDRSSFSKYFPVLKSLGLWLLMSFNMSIESVEARLLTQYNIKSTYLKNIKRYGFSIDAIGVKHTGIEKNDPLSRRAMDEFSQKNREISNNLGFTLYARIVNSGIDDEVLQMAYNATIKKRNEINNVWEYFHAACKKGSKLLGKQINWIDIYTRAKAAGCKPGDRLLLSDKEAQPTYAAPPVKTPKQETRKTSNNENNLFLRMFGVPKWTKDND